MDRIRASRIMEEHELDALIATTQENVAYASGFRTAESRPNYTTQFYAVIPREKSNPVMLVVPTISLTYVAQLKLPPDQVQTYGEFHFYVDEDADLRDAAKQLAELLANNRPSDNGRSALEAVLNSVGLSSGRLGLDEMGLDPTVYRQIEEDPNWEIIPGYRLLRSVRAIKTTDEIARLREAAELAEASVRVALDVMRPGVRHRDVVAAYRASVANAGGAPTHANFRFGPNAGMPSLLPSDTLLDEGQLIAWDVGLVQNLYQADTARCAIIGEPEDHVKICYGALRAGTEAGIAAIRPGVSASEVFDVVVATVRENGIPDYERNHTGHGIGVEAYDEPLIAASSETVLEPGMVLCIETPYYKLGFGSPLLEDTVVVTESGTEYLTHMDRELFII